MATTKNGYVVVVHGGVDEPLHYTDGCKAAAVRQLDTGKNAFRMGDTAMAGSIEEETVRRQPALRVPGRIEGGRKVIQHG